MDSTFKRKDRIAAFIQEEVMDILRREVTDPRIGFVTVTHVVVTDDLREARIFVSIFGDVEAKEKSMQGLRSATGFVRREVGRRLQIRLVPEIEFKRDDSIENSSRVLTLLTQIKREEESRVPQKRTIRKVKKKKRVVKK